MKFRDDPALREANRVYRHEAEEESVSGVIVLVLLIGFIVVMFVSNC